LGECDEIITTEMSSYGTNAAALYGKIATVCTHERFCFKRLSPEPCQTEPLGPIRYECGSRRPYVGSIQSSCNYFRSLMNTRKWWDYYDSWGWTKIELGPNVQDLLGIGNWTVGNKDGNVVP